MLNLVFCIKLKESFRRIQNTLKIDNNLELEEFIPNLEALQSNIAIKHYDIAVIDEKLSWKEEALDLLNKKGTSIILFKGNFKKTISEIYNKMPGSACDEASSNKNTETLSPYPNLNYYKNSTLHAIEENPTKAGPALFNGIENKLIIVGSLSHGAGSTFLSINLAKALTDLKIRTSVMEPPINEPTLFYYLGLDKKLATKCTGNTFYSYPHLINGGLKPPKNKETIIDNIVWLIQNPMEGAIDNWDHLKTIMLLDSSKRSPINIIDAGVNYSHESIEPLICAADLLLIVLNPISHELRKNKDKINELIKLKKGGLQVLFIVNYYTPSITKKDLSLYFKNIPLIYIPAIKTKYIQEAANKQVVPLAHPKISQMLFNPISEIVKNIIPVEVLKESIKSKYQNEENILNKLKEKLKGLKSIFANQPS